LNHRPPPSSSHPICFSLILSFDPIYYSVVDRDLKRNQEPNKKMAHTSARGEAPNIIQGSFTTHKRDNSACIGSSAGKLFLTNACSKYFSPYIN
jgi:hypothetical protein